MSRLLTEHETAYKLGCSVYKLQKDRVKGAGAPFRKLGRMVRYCPIELEAYIAKCRRFSTSQGEGGRYD